MPPRAERVVRKSSFESFYIRSKLILPARSSL